MRMICAAAVCLAVGGCAMFQGGGESPVVGDLLSLDDESVQEYLGRQPVRFPRTEPGVCYKSMPYIGRGRVRTCDI